RWLWYHARLRNGPVAPPLNVMVCEVNNGHTGRCMLRAAAVSDDAGNVAPADPRTIRFVRRDGTRPSHTPRRRRSSGTRPERRSLERNGILGAPAAMDVDFTIARDDCPASIPWGRYTLALDHGKGNDWTVTYPIVGALRYRAHEVPVRARGAVVSPNGTHALTGTGTQEALDMLASVTLRR